MRNQIFFAITLMFAVAISKAQTIPNANFEIWSNPNGYLMPNDWGTLNDITTSAGVYTATRGGSSSNYYLKLTSQNVTGMGVVPGIAVCGILNSGNLTAESGFPFSFRPTAFTGKWQYMGNSSNDIGYIKAYLTKWNTALGIRDTVGTASQNLNGMVMSWANFSFAFNYNNSDIPDTCIIIFSASGANAEAGSYLYVDNLGFSGITTGIANSEIKGSSNVFPNPATQEIQLNLSDLKSTVRQFEIIDITGKVVASIQSNGSIYQTISIAELPSAYYILRIITENGIVTEKIAKQ